MRKRAVNPVVIPVLLATVAGLILLWTVAVPGLAIRTSILELGVERETLRQERSLVSALGFWRAEVEQIRKQIAASPPAPPRITDADLIQVVSVVAEALPADVRLVGVQPDVDGRTGSLRVVIPLGRYDLATKAVYQIANVRGLAIRKLTIVRREYGIDIDVRWAINVSKKVEEPK